MQISEHVKGIRGMMGMVKEKEDRDKNKDTKSKLFYVLFPGVKPEGGK